LHESAGLFLSEPGPGLPGVWRRQKRLIMSEANGRLFLLDFPNQDHRR